MKILKALSALFLMAASTTLAQETRHEVVVPAPNPADDTKPNSDKVPDAYAISGHFDRVLVLRFKYNTDLLAGIEKLVKQEKIRNATFISAIGSVTGYQIHQVTSRTFPSRDTFVKNPTAAADIIGMSGYVMDGRIHAHMTLANPDKAFGGHLEPGTTVYTFAIVTLGVFDASVDLSRIDDKTYR